jgi:hypothetical protein
MRREINVSVNDCEILDASGESDVNGEDALSLELYKLSKIISSSLRESNPRFLEPNPLNN